MPVPTDISGADDERALSNQVYLVDGWGTVGNARKMKWWANVV